MKDKVKQISIILLITTLLFSSDGQIFGQEKTNISIGIGLYDLVNVGIKYQFLNQAKIGLNVGYWPPNRPGMIHWDHLISLLGDFYYHFGGSSKFSDLRPWYGRIGYCVLLNLPNGIELQYPYLRIGRDLFLNQNSGISIDGGIGLSFYHSDIDIYPFPTLGVCYFYRF
jgi:hypothetical protein